MSLQDVADMRQAAIVARMVADAAQDDFVDAVRRELAAGAGVPEVAAYLGIDRTSLYQSLRRRRRSHARQEWGEVAAKTSAEVAASKRWSRMQAVDDYRVARHAELLAQEERTKCARGEIELERENGVKQPITFREWITGGGLAAG